jgi:hypothetical protein
VGRPIMAWWSGYTEHSKISDYYIHLVSLVRALEIEESVRMDNRFRSLLCVKMSRESAENSRTERKRAIKEQALYGLRTRISD